MIIIPFDNSVRTPIFQPTEWRFVQDLKAVNVAIQPQVPVVPNPYTILQQIPESNMFYSVIDLANALCSIPVDHDSQYWFAFTFKDRTYTWTRLPQGYAEAQTIFHQALQTDLDDLTLPGGSVVL